MVAAPVSDPTISPPAPPTDDPLIGTVLAERYKVLDRIGEGGMGSVYLAQHVTLGKQVALKVLKQEMCFDKTIVERFLREAKATSSIELPAASVTPLVILIGTPQAVSGLRR